MGYLRTSLSGKDATAVKGTNYIEAISDIEAHVASAPKKATIKPYVMVTPPPLTNAVTKNLSSAEYASRDVLEQYTGLRDC